MYPNIPSGHDSPGDLNRRALIRVAKERQTPTAPHASNQRYFHLWHVWAAVWTMGAILLAMVGVVVWQIWLHCGAAIEWAVKGGLLK